jgi:serine/threonine protein kinase
VLERHVAVKQLSSIDPNKLERFRREARALALLKHPHIVTVLDSGADGDAQFIVLEYVEGETLKQRIRRGALPIDEAVAYAIEVARALSAAHEHCASPSAPLSSTASSTAT